MLRIGRRILLIFFDFLSLKLIKFRVTSSERCLYTYCFMPQQNDKITIMDIESPNLKEDQNLLLAPWGNNHIAFTNGDSPSPRIPKSPSSVFSFAPKSPGAGSKGSRY